MDSIFLMVLPVVSTLDGSCDAFDDAFLPANNKTCDITFRKPCSVFLELNQMERLSVDEMSDQESECLLDDTTCVESVRDLVSIPDPGNEKRKRKKISYHKKVAEKQTHYQNASAMKPAQMSTTPAARLALKTSVYPSDQAPPPPTMFASVPQGYWNNQYQQLVHDISLASSKFYFSRLTRFPVLILCR